jgi:hypothetical protein
MSPATVSSEEILKKVQSKITEQNEVIREQQVQIQEQENKLRELEEKLQGLQSAETEKNDILSKLAELIE